MGSKRAAAGWSCCCTTCLSRPATAAAVSRPGPPTGAGCGPGQILHFGPDLQAEIVSLPEPGVAEVRFWAAGEVLPQVLEQGEVPLPPYIQRPAGEADRDNYQTVFARQTGAVACPTAGLHFTDEVIQDLAGQGDRDGLHHPARGARHLPAGAPRRLYPASDAAGIF